jgi:hypothetical protein
MVSARIRFALSVVLLATVYYYLLVYLIGWVNTYPRPVWWFGVFPSRGVGVIAWVVTIHTVAVFSAALPVGVAAVLVVRKKAVLLSSIAALIATAVAAVPSFTPTIWPLIWNSHPVFFITDQIKLIVAVPFIAWVLRGASSDNRLERSPAVGDGVGR